MPRWPEKTLDTQEHTVGQDKEVVLPASGSIIEALDELKTIEPVHTDGVDTQYADALAFMEEKVTIMVNDDSDPNAENPIQVSCNGVNQFFFRNQAQEVKRKYIEILAKAKRTRILTPEVTGPDGTRTNAIRQQTTLRYPFTVLSDPNPKGMAWLKSVLSQG